MALYPSNGISAGQDGNFLLELCSNTNRSNAKILGCHGFLSGYLIATESYTVVLSAHPTLVRSNKLGKEQVETLGKASDIIRKIGFRACPLPDDMNTNQMKLIISNYLHSHPEVLHLPASALLLHIFNEERFPC